MSRTEDPRFHRQGALVELTFDGEPVEAIEGETIAAALVAAGRHTLGHDRDGNPRGLFCGMGVCFECLVSVDGGPGVRACLAKVAPGMRVRSLDYRVALDASPAPIPESRAARETGAGERRADDRRQGERANDERHQGERAEDEEDECEGVECEGVECEGVEGEEVEGEGFKDEAVEGEEVEGERFKDEAVEGEEVEGEGFEDEGIEGEEVEGEEVEGEKGPARRCDLLILGAGPAGLAAAEAAARHGRTVIVVDERPEPGGQYFKPLAPSQAFSAGRPADEQYAEGRALLERTLSAGAEIISGATAWSAHRAESGEITLALTSSPHPPPSPGQAPPPSSGQAPPPGSGQAEPARPGVLDRQSSGQAEPARPGVLDRQSSGQAEPARSGVLDRQSSGQAEPASPGVLDRQSSGQAEPARPGVLDRQSSGQAEPARPGVLDRQSSGQAEPPKVGCPELRGDREPGDRQEAGCPEFVSGQKAGCPELGGGPELGGDPEPGDRQRSGCPELVSAGQLIVASGAYERAVPFPGWTLPGVVTTGAAQSLLRSYRVAVGKRVLVAGNGPLNLQVASELIAAGVHVVAVAETAPAPLPKRAGAALRALWEAPALVWAGLAYRRTLRARGVPVLHGHRIAAVEGEGRVSRALLEPVDGAGARRTLDVDAVCVGYGFLPSNEIARLLGCEFDAIGPGHLVPRRGGEGRTTVPNVFLVGDGGAFGGARVAMAEGRLAAAAALRASGVAVPPDAPAERALARHRRFQRALWALFAAPDPGLELAEDDTLVCRCESVSLARVRALVRGGARDLRALKCASRAGMGRCQGRYCTANLARLLERETGALPDARALFAPQVPAKPVPVDALAAERPEWSGYRPAPVDAPVGAIPRARAAPGTDADVLVIGAGVVGICAAYDLARAGVSTLLVDRGAPNGQASGGNAGSLHLQLLSFDAAAGATETRSPALRTLALQAEGIALWQALAEELGADLELQITGGLMVAESAADLAFLERKTAAERSVGVEAEVIGPAELRALAPAVSSAMIGAAYCPGEGKINPLAATPAILAAACEAGLATRFGVAVTGIERAGGGYLVATDAGAIRCRRIVNAAGGWSRAIAALAGLDLPVLSAPQQMIVTEPAAPLVGHLLAHAHRHLTMKQARSGNLIIGGGWFAGFDPALGRPVTLPESIGGNLWAARRVVPAVAGLNVIRTWAAVGVSIDGAPILGEAPGHPGFYNAVGANGYTMGPIMGRVTAELITTGHAEHDIRGFTLERF